MAGVKIYNRTYYEGECLEFDVGQRDLNGTPWDDNCQSVRVPDGYKLTLARNYGLSGGSLVLYPGDYPNAIFQQDKMYSYDNPNKGSSIKVEKVEGFTRERQVKVFGIINWAYPNEYFFNIPVGTGTQDRDYFLTTTCGKYKCPRGLKLPCIKMGTSQAHSTPLTAPVNTS